MTRLFLAAALVPFLSLACATAVGEDSSGGLGGDSSGSGGTSSGAGGRASGGSSSGSGGGLVGATGGSSSGGGSSTGGGSSGGSSSGGSSSGGSSSGGSSSGGSSSGGSSGNGCQTPWQAQVYATAGTRVSQDGTEYENCYYAQANQEPKNYTNSSCSSGDPWIVIGPCS